MSRYTAEDGQFEALDGILYRNLKPLIWEVGRLGSNWFVTVEIGATFDVSIPVWLRWLFDPHDKRFLKAAALHDEMLRQGFDRLTAASVFNNALRADGVQALERLSMTAAVAFWKWN